MSETPSATTRSAPTETPTPNVAPSGNYYVDPESRVIYFSDGYHGGVLFPGRGSVNSALQEVVTLLEQFPDYRVALEIEANAWTDNDVLASLRPYVDSGRVELVGGTLSQPYLFPNHPESIIRQFIVGKRLVQSLFNTEIVTYAAQEPDFTTQLPQILTGMGFRYLKLFDRWMDFGSPPSIDDTLFWLRGPDGSKILTSPRYSSQAPVSYWLTEPYGSKGLGIYPDRQQTEANYDVGAPAPLMLTLEDFLPHHLTPWPGFDLIHQPPFFVRWTTPRGYFEELLTPRAGAAAVPLNERTVSVDLMVHNPWPGAPDDFLPYPWGVAAGTIQRDARQMEAATIEAEKWAAFATYFLGAPYPATDIDSIWRRTLQAQNHDVWVINPNPGTLPGRRDSVLQDSAKVLGAALSVFSAAIDTKAAAPDPSATPFIVFNAHSQPVSTVVELPVGTSPPAALTVVDEHGAAVPYQVPAAELSSNTVLVAADVPAVGFRTYYVRSAASADSAPENNVQASIAGDVVRMESDRYAVELDLARGGALTRLFDKVLSRELIPSDVAAHYFTASFPDNGGRASSLDQPATGRILESGPLRAAVSISNRTYPAPYTFVISLSAGAPQVDFDTVFDFVPDLQIGASAYGRESWRANAPKLNVHLPIVAGATEVLRDAPAHIEPTALKSFWALQFAASVAPDLSVAVLLDRPSAFVRDATSLALVLAYSGEYVIGRPHLASGEHYRYALASVADPWAGIGLAGRAAQWSTRPSVTAGSIHVGTLPSATSLLGIESESTQLLAAYNDSGRLQLRLYHPSPQAAQATVTSEKQPQAVIETDMRGYDQAELPNGLLNLRPFGLHTVAFGARSEPPPPTPTLPRLEPFQADSSTLLALLQAPVPPLTSKRYYLKPDGRADSLHPRIPQPRKDAAEPDMPLAFVSDALPADVRLTGPARVRLFVGLRTNTPPASTLHAAVQLATATQPDLAAGEATAPLSDCTIWTADDTGTMCVREIEFDVPGTDGQTLTAGEQLRISLRLHSVPAVNVLFLYDSTLYPSAIDLPIERLISIGDIHVAGEAPSEITIEVNDLAGSADLQDVGVLVLDASQHPVNTQVSAAFIKDLAPTRSAWRFVWDGLIPPGSSIVAVARNTAGAFASGSLRY